ncbi:MAG: type II toxin-antitoxin system VapC family toxin [Bacteroidota bacterium]|nr:type II toxin-antitoxin system VapC family toxin [Bacteroidota bacterium]
MAFKVFLDANILIDITFSRPKAEAARAILQAGIDGKAELYTTPSVLQITAYFTAAQFSRRQTKEILLTLLNDVKVIDCDHNTALIALSNGEIEDTEDALQYFTALKNRIDFFISSDKKLKKAALPQLPVYTADQMLSEINN